MLGGILQAGISTKVVLLNFEIINEYGGKRSCKLVLNEGSSFTDTLVKLRVKHENYQIQLNGEKLDWSDKVKKILMMAKDLCRRFYSWKIMIC